MRSAVRAGSAAWSAVRSVTPSNRALSLLPGGGSGTSELSVFVSALPLRIFFYLLSADEAVQLGCVPYDGSINHRRGRVSGKVRVRVKRAHLRPRATASSINRPNINSWESNTPGSPSRTSASFAHATVTTGVVADVPYQAPNHRGCRGRRSPCVRACAIGPAIERVYMQSAPGSVQNPPELSVPGPKNRQLGRSRASEERRTVLNLGFALSRSKHVCAPSSGLCPPDPRSCIMQPSHCV
jgi:hypothetical protein